MKLSLSALTFTLCLLAYDTLASTHLPAEYPLNKIMITVIHPIQQNTPESYRITLDGSGNSFYAHHNQEKQALTLSNDTLLELVNEFYTIHFFDLVDNYAIKKQVVMKADKTVTTVINKQTKANGSRICIQLRKFKKCVTIVDGQPASAAQLVKKIENLTIPK